MPRRVPVTGLRGLLSVDLRALGVFRMALGALVALDAALRLEDLRAHYTDFGVLPAGPYLERFADARHVSLFLANGSAAWAACLFGLTILAGAALAAGWRTRLATAVAWVLVVSVQNRNPMVLNGGDTLLRCLLFWGMFLPLGARFSVDAVPAPETPRDRCWFGAASIGLLAQIVWVYFGTALLKIGPEWWPQGSASWYALNVEAFTTPLGLWLKQFTTFLRVSSYAVYFLEWSVAFVVLCPFYATALRTALVILLAGMHLGFDATMRLGLFPWIDVASLVVLLPPAVLDRLGARLAPLADRARRRAAALARRLALPPRPPRLLPSALGSFLAVFFTGYIGLWNLQNVPRFNLVMIEPWVHLGAILRLDQNWNMFAPYPMKEGGWYVMPGKLKDGTAVDVLAGKPGAVTEARPELISALYPNARWRKFLMNLYDKRFTDYRLYYGKWLCRAWNEHAAPGRALATFDIAFMAVPTPPPGGAAKATRVPLWTHDCFGK